MTRRVLAVSAAGLLWVAITGVITAPSAIAPDPLRQQGEACPVQARSTDGPAELAQFDFLVGHWDATVTLQAGGEPKGVNS